MKNTHVGFYAFKFMSVYSNVTLIIVKKMVLFYPRSCTLPLSLKSMSYLVVLHVSKAPSPIIDLCWWVCFLCHWEDWRNRRKLPRLLLLPLSTYQHLLWLILPSNMLLCKKHLCSYLKAILQFMKCIFSICRNITPETVPSYLHIISCLFYTR